LRSARIDDARIFLDTTRKDCFDPAMRPSNCMDPIRDADGRRNRHRPLMRRSGDSFSRRMAMRSTSYRLSGLSGAGFRTIIEEDVQAGLRTTTTFHQKFPLTSQPERVVVNPTSRSGEDGAIKREQYTWRCDRTNRSNASACVPVLGVPTKGL
jgi:hypothetical protein